MQTSCFACFVLLPLLWLTFRIWEHPADSTTYRKKDPLRKTDHLSFYSVLLTTGVLGSGSSDADCRHRVSLRRLLDPPQNRVLRRGRPVLCGPPGHQLQQGSAPQHSVWDRAVMPRFCSGCDGRRSLGPAQGQLKRTAISPIEGSESKGRAGLEIEGMRCWWSRCDN